LCGKKVILLERSDLEEHPEENVLKYAVDKKVCLLVSGDPMVATTHSDLVLRARKKGISVSFVHASSVFSAVAETGLQIYKFGKTTTIAYPEGSYFPMSPYDVLKQNKDAGLHTLCLLDVKAGEGKYMSVSEAVELILRMEESKKQDVFTKDSLCVGVARLGGDLKIKAGKASEIAKTDFGKPPHILIIPGKMHYMEEEFLKFFSD
jgi:diphthine synthase